MFNLRRDLLEKIIKVLPAGKSPTVIDLVDKNYCAIHIFCNENEIWEVCDKLQKSGAEDILVIDVNLRFL